MRITRQFTEPGKAPYDGAFVGFFVSAPSGSTGPARFLVTDGIAAHLRPVQEEDVPDWLWRHEPDEMALATLPESERYRGEAGLADAIDRLAGGWTYNGWKGGYFDSKKDARAFFDEVRWLLSRGKCSPDIAQWRSMGAYWAYGLAAGDETGFVTDYRTGTVRRAEAGDLAPHGMFINAAHDGLSGEGGGLDLWRRETEQLAYGATCGANISDAASRGAKDFLTIGEATARYARIASGGHAGSARRITVDASHPESMEIAGRHVANMNIGEFTETGRTLVHRHVRLILDACCGASDRRAGDARGNTRLRLALQSARQAMVPETVIDRTLELVKQDPRITAEDVLANAMHRTGGGDAPDRDAMTVIRVRDDVMRNATAGRPDGAASIVDTAAIAAWTVGNTGLDFADTIDEWNGCAAAGEIRSASGNGGYLFLDDTAAECASLNAVSFLCADGSFDDDAFRHAARLMTLALDISIMARTLPSPRLARRVWDFRPLALSVGGVGDLLMACGLPYDSDEGRAYCAGLCALLSGAASLTSSEMAEELGPCPAWSDNAPALQRVLMAQREAVGDRIASMPSGIADAVDALWDTVPDAVATNGLRNACLTAICTAPRESAAMDCTAAGVTPVPSLLRHEPSGTTGWRESIIPAVPAALHALGYSQAQADAIVRHVVGQGTLARAPGVNHETLRRRGFTEAAIATVEAALANSDDISQAFNRWVLGDRFCRQMLGFTADELADEGFDMLAALGFSDAGIEAANIFCFGAGTMEGAPYLKPHHLPVFDCAEPQGARGWRRVSPENTVRMMAAAQPFVSGGIGHTVVMPRTATMSDCRAIFELAWRLGLKSLVLRGREAAPGIPVHLHQQANGAAATGPVELSLIAASGNRVEARVAGAAGSHSSDAPGSPESAIATDAIPVDRDAETSRSASSLAARSTASVSSSADAVVEQRQV